MTKEEIQLLAEKIVSGRATEEEIVLYNRICAYGETTGNDAGKISDAEKAELENALKQTILRKIGRSKVYHLKWFTYAAASIVLLLLVGGVYFWLNERHKRQPEYAKERSYKGDALPARPGAILTLANGQKILLDSAANGALANEGGARVSKKADGVVYDNTDKKATVAWNTMTTPWGRQYQLTLADGTKVWLNAGSSLTYPTVFAGKQRTVMVTGEVYFEVAHNGQMPFIVEKGDVKVQGAGTHFNMNTYDDENALKVTLLEGSVHVSAIPDKSGLAGNPQSAILKPGEQAVISPSIGGGRGEALTIDHSPDLEQVMAWKNGRFVFAGSDIGQLMRQLARWYNVEVEYKIPVTDLFYAEIPRNTRLSDVLKALELTGKVHFTIAGNKVIVTP